MPTTMPPIPKVTETEILHFLAAARELRFARCCYDHLAGTLGVAVTRGMLEHGFLFEGGERDYGLTPSGVVTSTR